MFINAKKEFKESAVKTAIGFNLGMRGDIIMNTVAARAFKLEYPNSKLTLGVGPQYADMANLFLNHKEIDSFHVYSSYDNWPIEEDTKYLEEKKYDITFDGMPQHSCHDWHTKYHQCLEVCNMHKLPDPKDYSCNLTKWFPDNNLLDKDFIAFAPFAGYYNKNSKKKLSLEKAQEIVNLCRSLGFNVLQVGGPDEPRLNKTHTMHVSYFESVRNVLSCQMLIHTDTGMGWAASAYKHPCIGLYMQDYYDGADVKNIQPINPNGIYLTEKNVNDISLDTLKEKIQLLE